MGKSKANEFQERSQQDQLTEIRHLGVQAIPLARIVGSVNRWQDFDRRFHSKRAIQSRFSSVLRALERGVVLPPIYVYKIKDDYYVIDGNHRVAAAKKIGQVDIDAEVWEMLPFADSPEHLLWREKSHLELLTGLTFQFSEPGSYHHVLQYLKDYQRERNSGPQADYSLKEAARSWRHEVYLPVSAVLRESGLADSFPGHTPDDLFLYLLHHQLTKTALQGRKVDLREAVAAFQKISPCQMEPFIKKLFGGFVFRKPCARNCQECLRNCPEGLICFENGRMTIAASCAGCASCAHGCPDQNLVPYENVALHP